MHEWNTISLGRQPSCDRSVRDRPPFLCKISAKSIEQFRRQTDKQQTTFIHSSAVTVWNSILHCFSRRKDQNMHTCTENQFWSYDLTDPQLFKLWQLYCVFKKTGPLWLIWHNFTSSQRSLTIFGEERPYSILQWHNFLNWPRTSCVVSITTVVTWYT